MNRNEVLANVLAGPIEPVRKSIFYRAGILLVAVIMVLLPCFYGGLMVLVGVGTWWHATRDTVLLTEGRFGILAYLAPVLLGLALLVIMLKPLLAGRARRPPVVELSPTDDPRLFEHVRRLSRLLRSPVPRKICVDCDVNASAAFRRGWWSLLLANDLTLTIGLPLVVTMDVRQLTGIVAHELGHFAQGGGMRLTFIVRSINLWFARVVYDNDEIDAALAAAMKGSKTQVYAMVLVAIVWAGVWLTKKILWVLMVTGHAVSSYLMREMEFDADRYGARVAGGEAFERTALQLPHLGLAFQAAESDLALLWRGERMSSDLPGLVADHFQRQPAELRAAVDEKVLAFHTGVFGTHPSTSDRIASARRENAPGIVSIDAPATILFADMPGISRQATLAWYQARLGRQITEAGMVDHGAVEQEKKEVIAAQVALASRVPLEVMFLNPITLRRGDLLSEELPALRGRLEKCRESLPGIRAAALEKLATSAKPDDPRILRVAFDPLVEAETERLRCAVSILHCPEGKALLGDAGPAFHAEAGRLLECLEGLASTIAHVMRLTGQANALHNMFTLEPTSLTDEDRKEIRSYSGGILSTLIDIRQKLQSTPYPFAHARGGATAADTCLPVLPQATNPADCLNRAGYAANGFLQLYVRTLGRLVALADQVEAALQMEPLPPPAGPDSITGPASIT